MLILVLAAVITSGACADEVLIRDIDHRNLVGPFDMAPDVDCAMRELSWRFVQFMIVFTFI